MSELDKSEAARSLSKRGASKGGRARANALTPEERSEIARDAVNRRWMKAGKARELREQDSTEPASSSPSPGPEEPPYSMFRGDLEIGDISLECHVLNSHVRVLTQREVVKALSGGRESGNLTRYLDRNPMYQAGMFDDRVIRFRIPGQQQVEAIGYDAEVLVDICELYLDARTQGKLHPRQVKLAEMAEIIMRACAKIGIIALIDEATGYQEVRKKRDLQLKLQAFIADDMQEWARMFPDEFWIQLARLEGVKYSARHRPLRWGKYVMAFVYDAIDPDIGRELREINPNPRHRKNHHQWLREFGRERVNNQIQQVIAIMKLCDDMDDFRVKFDRVFSKDGYQATLFE
ncbi:hypothetical protein SEA_KUWABARA_48 [Gordonia phage Kuwabara]|nr:hypothetical protein SEA_KUWABARA_48 [Gordonia phage Kuwabara]